MTETLLMKHRGRLQLPYFAQHHQPLLAEAARESWPHGRVLEESVVGEVARRDEALTLRRVKAARLPGIETLGGFDWSWPKRINRAQVQHLFRLEFMPQHGNVILLGGVGVGKASLGRRAGSCGLPARQNGVVHQCRRYRQCAGCRAGHRWDQA